MTTYNIYKKRDGQSFKEVGSIYADSFDEACKQFAKQMTDDNHNQSNNIQWLDKEQDGVKETGWYDFSAGCPARDEETEKYDADEVADFLLVTEAAINEGFSSWNEDVYTWEVREALDYMEIYDMDDFNNSKDGFDYFMNFNQGERYFLYSGKFDDIAEVEGLGYYDYRSDKFMGCPVAETEIVELSF